MRFLKKYKIIFNKSCFKRNKSYLCHPLENNRDEKLRSETEGFAEIKKGAK